MIRNSATLKRWSAFAPGTRLPDSIEELPLEQQMQLRAVDSELYQLLSGSASAELELAAIEGSLADAPVPAAVLEEQARAARVQEILAQQPGGSLGSYAADGSYVEGKPASLDLLMELAVLDPAAHAQQELIRKGPQADPTAAEQSARAAALAQQRVQSLNHSIGAR